MLCISYGRELRPLQCQDQKSFHGKAVTYRIEDGTELLKSYKTIVASIDADGNVRRHWSGWSATTGRHIKAFCGMNKAEFKALPLEPKPDGAYLVID